MKDYLEIAGRQYRVEVNWNAVVAFLSATGKDTWEGLSSFAAVKPSDLAPLLAAAINEGERLEGRESHFTAEEIGATCGFEIITAFLPIYQKQTMPKNSVPEENKKKD